MCDEDEIVVKKVLSAMHAAWRGVPKSDVQDFCLNVVYVGIISAVGPIGRNTFGTSRLPQ